MGFWLEMTSMATASLFVFTVEVMFWPEADRAAMANAENARIGRKNPRRGCPFRPKSGGAVEKKMDSLGTVLLTRDKLPNILGLTGCFQRLDFWFGASLGQGRSAPASRLGPSSRLS